MIQRKSSFIRAMIVDVLLIFCVLQTLYSTRFESSLEGIVYRDFVIIVSAGWLRIIWSRPLNRFPYISEPMLQALFVIRYHFVVWTVVWMAIRAVLRIIIWIGGVLGWGMPWPVEVVLTILQPLAVLHLFQLDLLGIGAFCVLNLVIHLCLPWSLIAD
jgi:hypothetical protein